MVKKTTSVIHLSDNDISNVVIKEREIIDVAFKRVSGSKKKAKAFLVSAGIMSKDGKLTEAYR